MEFQTLLVLTPVLKYQPCFTSSWTAVSPTALTFAFASPQTSHADTPQFEKPGLRDRALNLQVPEVSWAKTPCLAIHSSQHVCLAHTCFQQTKESVR